MGARTRTLGDLPEVLAEVVFISEIRIIEQMHRPSFLFAKSLSLCQSRRRFYFFLSSKLMKGLMNQLARILIVFSLAIPAIQAVQVTWARTLEHLVIVPVNLLPKVLQARVFLSGWTIVKAEVDLASLGERETWRILVSIHIILPVNVERVNVGMLARADLIHIGGVHGKIGHSRAIIELFV